MFVRIGIGIGIGVGAGIGTGVRVEVGKGGVCTGGYYTVLGPFLPSFLGSFLPSWVPSFLPSFLCGVIIFFQLFSFFDVQQVFFVFLLVFFLIGCPDVSGTLQGMKTTLAKGMMPQCNWTRVRCN